MTTKALAASYIGRAKNAHPIERGKILRDAAGEFARLAAHPGNAEHRAELTAIGFQFAEASMRFEPTAPGLRHDASTDARAFEALHALYPEGIEHAIEQGEGPSIGPSQKMSIQPATFTQETTLGRMADITFQPTAEQTAAGIKNSDTVAFWQGAKTESQAMSVDVALVFNPTKVQLQTILKRVLDARPYAIIRSGADGNISVEVPIDVGLGRRVTVVGNYISVVVGMDPPRSGLNSDSPVLTVGASIATFAAPSEAPVTRTLYIDALAPNIASAPIPIPLRAVRLLPPLGALTTDIIGVDFLSFSGVGIGAWATGNPLPFPVPPDAYYVTITSATGLLRQGPGIRIPFELSL